MPKTFLNMLHQIHLKLSMIMFFFMNMWLSLHVCYKKWMRTVRYFTGWNVNIDMIIIKITIICVTVVFIAMLCIMMHAYMTCFIVLISQNHGVPHSIANWDWSIPNSRSTSFLINSYRLENNFLFYPCDIGIVLTNAAHSE